MRPKVVRCVQWHKQGPARQMEPKRKPYPAMRCQASLTGIACQPVHCSSTRFCNPDTCYIRIIMLAAPGVQEPLHSRCSS